MAQCPIWCVDAELVNSGELLVDASFYDSARAGGRFIITRTAEALLENDLGKKHRARISFEILRANLEGDAPKLTSAVLRDSLRWPAPSISDRVDLLLRWAISQNDEMSAYIEVPYDVIAVAGLSTEALADFADTWIFFKEYLINHDLILPNPSEPSRALNLQFLGEFGFRLSEKGFERASTLGTANASSEQIFVAMWFSPETSEFFTQAIKPGIEDAGYVPLRIDDVEHNEMIDDQIIAEIRRSKAMLCDVSTEVLHPLNEDGKPGDPYGVPRGGVYYEAGFAKGLGIPVIWTVRQDIAEVRNVVHFDVRQMNQIRWETDKLEEARKRITNRLVATMGEGPRLVRGIGSVNAESD